MEFVRLSLKEILTVAVVLKVQYVFFMANHSLSICLISFLDIAVFGKDDLVDFPIKNVPDGALLKVNSPFSLTVRQPKK